MAIHESGEDYLEAILMIQKRNGNVRSIDIAHELSFSKPSVSVAMKNLKASNYITIDENGFINLTAFPLILHAREVDKPCSLKNGVSPVFIITEDPVP